MLHFPHPPPRVVSSVEGSTQCTRILANTRNLHFNCEEREGREGKEKRGGSARYSSPSGKEGATSSSFVHSSIRILRVPGLSWGKGCFERREKLCVFVYYIELYAMKFKIIYSCNRCTNHCDCTSSNMMESV